MGDHNGLTFVIDIDGTICPVRQVSQRYEDIVPHPPIVKRMREYKEAGARIVLYTARNMNTYNGNIGLINANTAKVLLSWLEEWDIPYDEIVYGKVWPGNNGFYVDDRTVRPDEFLNCTPGELKAICDGSMLRYDGGQALGKDDE